jgi:hypothetical protein
MAEISLGEALQLFLSKSKLKTGIQAVQIKEVWEKLMGVTIAKYTDNIQIIGSTLFITTQVAPLRNELMFQKENIIARVNETLGSNTIKEVVIK